MARHKLFHTLFFGALALDGCASSHFEQPLPVDPDAGMDTLPSWDGGPDTSTTPDAGLDAGDDSASPDAGDDAPFGGGHDAGSRDAGDDAGPFDAGFDASDPRFCEPGWPTTKAMICVTVEGEDGSTWLECRRHPDEEACIVPESVQP